MLPDAFDFADVPQLFVEEALIADAAGLRRRVHQMTKHAAQPIVATNRPWEGAFLTPVSVSRDAGTGQWRMWYTSYGQRELPLPGRRNYAVHLATSPDGLRWEKPPLGALMLDGQDTNILTFADGSPFPDACAVFDEPQDPDPARRYKLLYYLPNYYLAYSADGVRWRAAQPDPVWPNGAGDGLEETYFFMRDAQVGKYRGYMRVWQRHQTIRKTSLGESDDLLRWSGPTIIWEAEPAYGLGAQLYGMNVFFDGGLYWALPWIFYTDQPLDPNLQQTMRFKLAWSKDGVEWHALAPEQDAVPMGAPGSFDSGMMLSSCPAVMLDDRVRLYYYGANVRHNGPRAGDAHAAVGLAEIRRHGFVSLRADGDGALITRRFLFRGEGLRINTRTESDGYVLAELLDDRGEIVKGRAFAQADPFTGDAVDHRLTWGGDGNLASLYGQNVMLRLRLRQADLFSFRADGPRERFTGAISPHPVRCGRCMAPPVIDGQLDDTCWQDFSNSGTADDFVTFTEIAPAPVKTRVMLTRDDAHLYLSVDCEEPLTDRLRLDNPGRAIDYQHDEVIEIRLGAPGQGTHFNQLMFTPAGGKWQAWFSVEEGGSRIDENPAWVVKTAVIPGHWYAELAVPFAALDTPPPAADEQWQMNILRHRQVTGAREVSCWSCMFGSVHRNDRSGTLVFV